MLKKFQFDKYNDTNIFSNAMYIRNIATFAFVRFCDIIKWTTVIDSSAKYIIHNVK